MSDDRLADLFTRIDDVLAGYEGQRTFEAVVDPDEGGCVRCGADAGGGDLCGSCRVFLLGDTDVDPARSAPSGVRSPDPLLAELRAGDGDLLERLAAGQLVALGEDGRLMAPEDAVREARRHLVAL